MSYLQPIPASFRLYISYSQITICRAGLKNPFNNWSQAHVSQGFAWRNGSVAFATLIEAGVAEISLKIKDEIELRDDTVRAIQVPFVIPMDGKLEIASITESKEIEMEPGDYALVFETGLLASGAVWCYFTLQKSKACAFKVLLADRDLSPGHELILTAEPA